MTTKLDIKVADEVWVAVALLHREQRAAADFSTEEILERASQEAITDELAELDTLERLHVEAGE